MRRPQGLALRPVIRRQILGTTLMAATLALQLIGCSAHVGTNVGDGPPAMAFGVLGSSCAPDRVAAERRAGIQTVTLELGWDRYEPEQGHFDVNYVADLRRKISVCRHAGLRILLSFGLQNPPAWVRRLPNGTYLDQYGNPPSMAEADLVFSQAVRDSVTSYLRRVSTDLGLGNVAAVRVGTNNTGELGYPGPSDGADQGDHDFWAFNVAAQTGDGLASGMSPAPMPGWVPGMTVWRGQPVSVEQTAAWFQWYDRALVGAISWQIDLLRTFGFTGSFEIPVAGRGALPQDLQSAVSSHLDGRGDPDGALERGLNYPDQFPLIADLDTRLKTQNPSTRIAMDFTGLDDNTAVRARAARPPQDTCQPDDTHGLLTRTGVDRWSAQRWTIANARRVHLSVFGENPGPPNAPHTGGSPDSDDEAQQLKHAVRYAKECQLVGFLWAFENNLFDHPSGVSLEDYAQAISEAQER